MHRSDDAAAPVVVQKRAIGVASGRDTPQRFHAAGVHFGVADVFGLLRRQVHRLDAVSDTLTMWATLRMEGRDEIPAGSEGQGAKSAHRLRARSLKTCGFNGVGVDALAAAAGVTSGALYSNFPNKEA